MSTFRFKQFSVQNEKSAMKVNTDSVLLGSWTTIPSNTQTILDIGSGTGVLGLMMAQRCPNSRVIGIEIEDEAFKETQYNFNQSPWKEQLTAIHSPLQKFKPTTLFNCIISNPPFFVNDLKNESSSKQMARHSDSLPFEELVQFVTAHLSDKGCFNLILPLAESETFRSLAKSHSLYLRQIGWVKPNPDKDINRVLMSFSLSEAKPIEETFCIYQSQGVYSERHTELTRDFYLD